MVGDDGKHGFGGAQISDGREYLMGFTLQS